MQNDRFEVMFSETSHLMLTSSQLRKRSKQSISACLSVMSSCGSSGKSQNIIYRVLPSSLLLHNDCLQNEGFEDYLECFALSSDF